MNLARLAMMAAVLCFVSGQVVSGGLVSMKKRLGQKRPLIDRCYRWYGNGKPGVLNLHLKVDQTGRIYASGIGETDFSRKLSACVITQTWNTRLSRYRRPYRLKHTLHFP